MDTFALSAQISGQFARLLLILVLANYITSEDNRIITSSNSSYDTSRALRNGRLTCTREVKMTKKVVFPQFIVMSYDEYRAYRVFIQHMSALYNEAVRVFGPERASQIMFNAQVAAGDEMTLETGQAWFDSINHAVREMRDLAGSLPFRPVELPPTADN